MGRPFLCGARQIYNRKKTLMTDGGLAKSYSSRERLEWRDHAWYS